MKTLFAIGLLCAYLSARALVHSAIDFTNLECTSLDKAFVDFEYCFLKSVNRSYKYMSLKANLFQVPVKEFFVTVAILKRANGFKPFLYNITVDACKYFKSRNSYKFIKFVHGTFEPYSNMNHSCPYDHDVYIEKVPVSHVNTLLGDILPIPLGVYRLDTLWTVYNIPRAHVVIQFVKT